MSYARLLPVALLVFCSAVIPLVAHAAPTPEQLALVEQLGSTDYITRREATSKLLQDQSLDTDKLTGLMQKTTTPEQRQRMLRIAKHHFLRSQLRDPPSNVRLTGALGIRHKIRQNGMLPGVDGAAAVVVQTLQGFPGYIAFEPGDLIIGFEGELWPDNLDTMIFGRMLAKHRAGDTVKFTVLRDGEQREVSLTLAPMPDLGRMYRESDGRLQRVIEQRWQESLAEMLENAPEVQPVPLSERPAATQPAATQASE